MSQNRSVTILVTGVLAAATGLTAFMPPGGPLPEWAFVGVAARIAAARAAESGAPPAVTPAPVVTTFDAVTRHTLPGSQFSFTKAQIENGFAPVDWFPGDHPVMPRAVAQGRAPDARACAFCHMTSGQGHPQNAPIAGMNREYMIQQLKEFVSGQRKTSDPRNLMTPIAKSLSEQDMEEVADYFAAIPYKPWIRVIEGDTIPSVKISGSIYVRADDGTTEPIGMRVIEAPENTHEAELRSPRSGFVAYVPAGSIKKGELLVTTGGNGKTLACTSCHGPDLRGVGIIPPIAGRSPSYMARQMYDMQQGLRDGALTVLMKPVVENLTNEDLINIVAYTASLKP